jgi:hypothetical protein
MAQDPSARFWCEECKRSLGGSEVEEILAGTTTFTMCPACKRAVVAEAGPAPDVVGTRVEPLPRVLAGAFLYPFRPQTLLLLGGVLLLSILVGLVPFLGGLLARAVQAAFLFQIVRSTADGQDDWVFGADDSGDIADWISPLGRYLGAFVTAGAPALAAWIGTQSPALTLAAGALGLVYLPAAFIAASYKSGGCLGPLNPLPALGVILRIPGPYAITLGFLALVVGADVGLFVALAALARAPGGGAIAAMLLSLAAGIISSTVMARMLGLLVREHGDELMGGP